jgi:dCMP deaminase
MFDEKWNERFLNVAELVSSWSKDPSTKCGAVIVRPNKTIASVGFNGFPRGTSDDQSVYLDRDLKLSRVVHAEQNAILNVGPETLEGYTLFSWPPSVGPSCDRCTAHIIQAGITTVVHKFKDDNDFNSRWSESIQRGLQMYDEAGVNVVVL